MEEISVSEVAAGQIKKAAIESQVDMLPLRLAATKNDDGSLHYGMGFDDVGNSKGEDVSFESHGVTIVVAKTSLFLLQGTVIDYVELEPKQFHFVFLNPNDPNYKPPAEESAE
ncbi:MAG: iron-sulfur cluster assembly accessory protein [Gammaproteobacteria bacterium]|nr:iron-sulfur cluster assembly accessory protein [Gammaproteobacteria bacterium]